MSIQYLDKAGAATMASKIKDLLAGKVDIKEGKTLSSNDYTDADKLKLSGIADNAEVNIIEAISVNNTVITPVSKGVNITIPTDLASFSDDESHRLVTDLEKNEWNSKQVALIFNTEYNASTNKAATMEDIKEAVGKITGIDFVVVDELPEIGKNGTIYLVPHNHGESDVYDEYIYVSSKWEKIGTTDIDLSNYVQKTDLNPIPDSEIIAMF